MTAIVTLPEAKLYLRVDHDVEDALIQMLIDAASDAVLDLTSAPILAGEVPNRYKLAVLTHVACAYDNRETGAEMPASAARLLFPFRKLEV